MQDYLIPAQENERAYIDNLGRVIRIRRVKRNATSICAFQTIQVCDRSSHRATIEQNHVAKLLALMNIRNIRLREGDIKKKEPDVIALFGSHEVGIEHTRITHQQGEELLKNINDVNKQFLAVVESNEDLKEKIDGRHFIVNLNLWLRRHPHERDYYKKIFKPDKLLEEIIRFACDTDFEATDDTVCIRNEGFPILSVFQASIHTALVDNLHSRTVEVHAPMKSVDPFYDTFEILSNAVTEKITFAREGRYASVGEKLWLAAYVLESTGFAQYTINLLKRTNANFYPYKKLIIGDRWDALVFEVDSYSVLNAAGLTLS